MRTARSSPCSLWSNHHRVIHEPVGRRVHHGLVTDVLDRFSAPTREWFAGAFDAPTPAQLGAWDAISSGAHTLVVAPTGSGKTLSAFLWSLDRLAARPETTDAPREHRTRVLYISPLKALGGRRRTQPPVAARRASPRPRNDSVWPHPRSPWVSAPATPRRPTAASSPVLPPTSSSPPPSRCFSCSPLPRAKRLPASQISDRRRGARRRRHQTRRASGAVPRASRSAAAPSPPNGSGCPRPCARARRWRRFLVRAEHPSGSWRPPATKTFDLTVRVPVDMTELGVSHPNEDSESPTPRPGRSGRTSRTRSSTSSTAHRSTIVFANSRRLAERLTAPAQRDLRRTQRRTPSTARPHRPRSWVRPPR